MKKNIIAIVVIFFTGFLLTACVNLHTKNVSQTQTHYGISVPTPAKVSHKKVGTLELAYPEISSQFAGLSFVYRIDELKYTSDFYNVFFSPPADQINYNVLKYLESAKPFAYISDNAYPIKPDYILKTNINDLYADYRNQNAPRAVISMRFVLIKTKDEPKVVLDKTFKERVLLTQKTSDALVKSWNKGLQRILENFTADIVK